MIKLFLSSTEFLTIEKERKGKQGKNLTKVDVNEYQEPRESFSL
jgi:hypothetical protein